MRSATASSRLDSMSAGTQDQPDVLPSTAGVQSAAVPATGRARRRLTPGESGPRAEKASDQLQRWLANDGEKTLGSLIEVLGVRSFAILFVVLLGVPALPLPTGG